jgi:hypothetical protein
LNQQLSRAIPSPAPLVNKITALLQQGKVPPLPPPTDNADGWLPYIEMFRTLGSHCVPGELAIELNDDYPATATSCDARQVVDAIGSFPITRLSVRDVLSAIEWCRTVQPWFFATYDDPGSGVVIDCRGLTGTTWSQAPEAAVMRGMMGIVSESNFWLLQNAGQAVDGWPHVQLVDPPIFTLHFAAQLDWMSTVRLLPTWLAAYVSQHELKLSSGLTAACFEAMKPEFDAYGGQLTVPKTLDDLFLIELEEGKQLSEAFWSQRGPH